MRRTLRLLAAGLTAIFAAAAFAADTDAVRALMDQSGMVQQFGQIGSATREDLLRSPPPELTPELAEKMADAVAVQLDGARLLADVEKALVRSLSDADVAALRKFYASDLGRRLVGAEIENVSAQARQEVEAAMTGGAPAGGKEPERAAAYRKMDESMGGAEVAAFIMESLLHAVVDGAAAVDAKAHENAVRSAAAHAQIDRMRPQLLEFAKAYVLAASERCYRDFSLAEIAEYQRFLDGAEAQLLFGITNGVAKPFIVAAGKAIGMEVARAVSSKRS